jgi:hypothetical protein
MSPKGSFKGRRRREASTEEILSHGTMRVATRHQFFGHVPGAAPSAVFITTGGVAVKAAASSHDQNQLSAHNHFLSLPGRAGVDTLQAIFFALS